MGFLSYLLPSDSKFYGLFEEVSTNLRSAAELLSRFAGEIPASDREELALGVKELEHANDVHTHKIFNELHSSFIMPFDREDIHQLAAALDDILDYATYTVQRAVAYQLVDLTNGAARQIECLASVIASVCDIIDRLRDLKNISEIAPYLQEVHRLENEGDQLYMDALTELFSGDPDPIMVIKLKDLHNLAETAIDRCERVADVAEGIAIKHA